MKKYIILLSIVFLPTSILANKQQILNQLEDHINRQNYKDLLQVYENSIKNGITEDIYKSHMVQQMPHSEFIKQNCGQCIKGSIYKFESCLKNCLNGLKNDIAEPAAKTNEKSPEEIAQSLAQFLGSKSAEDVVSACAGIDARLGIAKTCFLKVFSVESIKQFMFKNCSSCFSDTVSLSELVPCLSACTQDFLEKTTPLHKAARAGNLKLVKELLNAKADIHAQTAKGNTPLHLAAEHNHWDVAELLLDAGAKNTGNKEGKTPVDVANKQLVERLKARLAGSF